MRDAVISSAVFAPHGESVEKIGGVATAWPRDNTVDVAMVIGKVIASIEVHYSFLRSIDAITHFFQCAYDGVTVLGYEFDSICQGCSMSA